MAVTHLHVGRQLCACRMKAKGLRWVSMAFSPLPVVLQARSGVGGGRASPRERPRLQASLVSSAACQRPGESPHGTPAAGARASQPCTRGWVCPAVFFCIREVHRFTKELKVSILDIAGHICSLLRSVCSCFCFLLCLKNTKCTCVQRAIQ